MFRARSLVLALSLASGLAAPAGAVVFNVAIDGNALTLGGSATTVLGLPFRAVRDDPAKTITFTGSWMMRTSRSSSWRMKRWCVRKPRRV